LTNLGIAAQVDDVGFLGSSSKTGWAKISFAQPELVLDEEKVPGKY
jgi:hypothetical protein